MLFLIVSMIISTVFGGANAKADSPGYFYCQLRYSGNDTAEQSISNRAARIIDGQRTTKVEYSDSNIILSATHSQAGLVEGDMMYPEEIKITLTNPKTKQATTVKFIGHSPENIVLENDLMPVNGRNVLTGAAKVILPASLFLGCGLIQDPSQLIK